MTIGEQIGERIQTARKNAGMKQSELAEKLDVAVITIGQYERGKRRPRYEQLQRIAVALGVNWTELVPQEAEGAVIAAHVIEKAGLKLVSKKDGKVFSPPTPKERIAAALDQMTPEGQDRVADYAEDILPRYQASPAPQSPPAPPEDTDTTQNKKLPEDP